jgi:hypothetical protein
MSHGLTFSLVALFAFTAMALFTHLSQFPQGVFHAKQQDHPNNQVAS